MRYSVLVTIVDDLAVYFICVYVVWSEDVLSERRARQSPELSSTLYKWWIGGSDKRPDPTLRLRRVSSGPISDPFPVEN